MKRYMPTYTCSTVTAKTWEQPKCPLTEEWIKKMRYIYIYTVEYYLAINNELIPFTATWMDLDIIILSEVRESQKSYSITYKWNLIVEMIQMGTSLAVQWLGLHVSTAGTQI